MPALVLLELPSLVASLTMLGLFRYSVTLEGTVGTEAGQHIAGQNVVEHNGAHSGAVLHILLGQKMITIFYKSILLHDYKLHNLSLPATIITVGNKVSDDTLKSCANLFSSSYSIWGDQASTISKFTKARQKVKMTGARLQAQCLSHLENTVLVTCHL
ncbi:uncharacterized protein F5147DRAFT_647600 [Suillus discolor]|uniref:Uncharacterized protein n=1 Tax=Suillus discolor TaxID=1912936 RepID=A0A9P7FLV1_9AGAM|nr:uncharacterized protein F5147DRAFT_647600 [Suillus discolor]KAG2119703.1 hypothetical protein F5147DRAFT_647600 [Suillus discolor]